MKWPERKILLPLCVLLASVSMAAAVIFMSEKYQSVMNRKEAAAARKLSMTLALLSRGREGSRDSSLYEASYRRLVDRKIVGTPERLDLVEKIVKANSGDTLFSMNYEIAPEQKISLPPLEMKLNRVTFDLSALHETRITDFLETLQKTAEGLPFIENCAIDRIAQNTPLGFHPQLRTKCVVAWVSFGTSEGP